MNDLLREIREGKIQLPDFQRGWVWDDDPIRDLLVSIARSFPIGAVMLLEAGGEVRVQTRPVEGLEDVVPKERAPEKLILDGQQRLTTLTQALALAEPVSRVDRQEAPTLSQVRRSAFSIGELLVHDNGSLYHGGMLAPCEGHTAP